MSGERDDRPEPAPAPKHAGRQEVWPTLWHKDQIPMPWGTAKRERKRAAQAARIDAEQRRDEDAS
jgi:hypothetical protein